MPSFYNAVDVLRSTLLADAWFSDEAELAEMLFVAQKTSTIINILNKLEEMIREDFDEDDSIYPVLDEIATIRCIIYSWFEDK